MTDNAWAYRHSLTTMVAKLGATQIFIKPHCPWQNGKIERFTQTFQTEWAYRHPFTNNTERQAALAPWLNTHDNERRHTALGGKPLASRLAPTSWLGTPRN
ncbi:MAG: hypothetical protein B5766_05950 [Candidatus Lumbricidophila eiseniae]|uniref:Integrase catalytic domain-containing protein n=1 Tax=Candidatus Lumbricidiphila eiseniae TaxID=1969409 RepID=A0A2A6FRF0_9MICO|nr:MAG: hypothetical protein B5766_05950 [Candidatus Lumbricidophila eiseniae]